jgi:hypothetical protein
MTNDEVRRLASNIQRVQSLEQKKCYHRDNLEIVKWARHYVEERLGKLWNPDDLARVVRELKRPFRTDLQKQFAKAHDALCRKNNCRLPSYGEVHTQMKKMFPRNCVSSSIKIPSRNLRRMNKATLHLPMPKRARPKADKKQLSR